MISYLMETLKGSSTQKGKLQLSMNLSELKQILKSHKLKTILQIRLGSYKIIKAFQWTPKNVV
jgi:hypothetical protein